MRDFLFSRYGLGVIGFLAIAGYLLWAEHEAHIRLALPYLLYLALLACPLMHIFMHHGHGTHNGPHQKNARLKRGETETSDTFRDRQGR